jgi:D-serine deaminase-like pyridoxal phosphate-dependent protein
VQTPFKRKGGAPALYLGDPVVCRHAKSGELFERFADVYCIRGDQIVGREQSYRGLGQTFF